MLWQCYCCINTLAQKGKTKVTTPEDDSSTSGMKVSKSDNALDSILEQHDSQGVTVRFQGAVSQHWKQKGLLKGYCEITPFGQG